MAEADLYLVEEEEEKAEVEEDRPQDQILDEEERRQMARLTRMNKKWVEEGLEVRGKLECGFCAIQCPVAFPLPYVLFDKTCSNRKKSYEQSQKEVGINLRILGLNWLWAGNQVEKHSRKAIHWRCTSDELKRIFRTILRWEEKALNLPECEAAFLKLTRDIKVTYGHCVEDKLIDSKLVAAAQIALPKQAHRIIPMLDLLPNNLRNMYSSGEMLVSKELGDWEKASKIRVALRMPRLEYVKVLKIMVKLGMVEWKKQSEIRVSNGLQCVRKDENKLRLIFDGRPANCVLKEPPRTELPGFHLLANWNLNKEESCSFGKIDLGNYYHRIGIPNWLKEFLGLPKLSHQEMIEISEGKQQEADMGVVCTTLPMGLSHAVFLAQEIHMNMLQSTAPELPLNKSLTSNDKVWILVYIDDVLIGTRSKLKEEGSQLINTIIERFCRIYQRAGFEVNMTKLQWASENMVGLGCAFRGIEGVVSPTDERLAQLVSASRFLISLDWIKPKALEIVLGHWVWLLLLRRPFFSILFNVYRLLHNAQELSVCKFWDSAKNEIKLLIWLFRGIKMSWRRPRSGWILATDASLIGAGACEAWITDNQMNSLIWEQGGCQDIQNILPQISWSGVLQYKWGYKEHINVLEARALVMSMLNSLQSGKGFRDRWLCLVDSTVVLGAVRKGRSSAYALNNQLRRVLVLCLVADAALDVTWIPTDVNPADVLSRVFV